jgi:molybdenum cofactor cytidylyltransferase
MKSLTLDVRQSAGKVLFHTIFRPGGRKLFSRGHVLIDDDIRLLQEEGHAEVMVAELETGEISEDNAVMEVARAITCGKAEIRLAAGGRANITSTEPCSLLVDDDLLRQINCTSSVVISTLPNFAWTPAETRLATVKSAPFSVPREQLETILGILKERGPIMQARPIANPVIATLYTDPLNPDKARNLFEPIVRQKLERIGLSPRFALAALEDEESVVRGIHHILRAKPTALLIASTTAPAGPDDIIGQAMLKAGCQMERFLAPVEPGNLMLLGYKDEVPVLSAPGCYRSARPNIVDLLLPPMAARYRVSSWEIASLGHGGLLG